MKGDLVHPFGDPRNNCPDCGHGWYKHAQDGCAHLNGHDEYCDCTTMPPGMEEKLAEERRLRVLRERPCPTHRRYQVLRAPKSACEACWRLWIAANPK